MKELWSDIVGYEGLYKISTLGEIVKICQSGNKPMAIYTNPKHYCRIRLTKNGKAKTFLVHRLVYMTFKGEIPTGMQVHHKDGDKNNNKCQNLMLLSNGAHHKETAKQNPYMYNKSAISRTREVLQYTLQGSLLKEYNSPAEAAQHTGVCKRNIQQVCAGAINPNGEKRKQAGGYIWRYKQ